MITYGTIYVQLAHYIHLEQKINHGKIHGKIQAPRFAFRFSFWWHFAKRSAFRAQSRSSGEPVREDAVHTWR